MQELGVENELSSRCVSASLERDSSLLLASPAVHVCAQRIYSQGARCILPDEEFS